MGATEVYPFTGSANLISDITSTGKTIKSNNLRILKDGKILKSQACVFSSKKSLDKKVFIISGLGDPKFFEKTVEDLGYEICGFKNYPDHYHYKRSDLNEVELLARESGASQILTTEKDWVKLNELKPDIAFGIIDIDIRIQDEETLKKIIEPIC